jgi:xylitol oxidase
VTVREQNWAGNLTYGAATLHRPETVAELQELVRRSRSLKVLGTRHSFNEIADTRGDLVSLQNLERTIQIDAERRTVTVGARVTYGQLGPELQRAGFALANLASLPHISVAGACATATHGSGDGNGVLATAVSALELIRPDGEIVVLSRNNGEFDGAVVGLGGLGVVTRLTLDLVPDFMVQQEVYEGLPLARLEAQFDEITASAYSVSLFTDWQNGRIGQLWLKRRVPDGAALAPAADYLGATPATGHRHPILSLAADCCTEQMGIPGPWQERLPHFRMDHLPSSGAELQSEYLVPRHHAVAALRAVARLHEPLAPLLQVSELRTVAADTLWMSPCYQQPCLAIHFTWKKDWRAVRKLLPRIEEQLAPFGARPHWGKLFTLSSERLRSLYPRLRDFRELRREYDPNGKLRNAFLDRYL